MALTVAALNCNEAFSDPRRSRQMEENIKRLDADIVVLPEAHREQGVQGIESDFADQLGYHHRTEEYADEYPRAEQDKNFRQYITVLSRHEFVHSERLRLVTRNAIGVTVRDPDDGKTVSVAGLHGDDRWEWAPARQFGALRTKPRYEILAGDFNSPHRNTRTARLLRSAPMRRLAEWRDDPDSPYIGKLKRLSYMAEGGAFQLLEEAGYRDADPRHRGTLLVAKTGMRFAIAQLDHLLYQPKEVRVSDFRRYKLSGTDHCAIAATFSPA